MSEKRGDEFKNKNVFTISHVEVDTKNNEEKAADFETAISATGFGKFNVFLIIMAIPCGWSSIFETTTMSYVFPAAQCDLDLSLKDKGLLNAITYSGMISSAFIWGYLCDTLGRKKLLAIGLLLDGFFVLLSASSQDVVLLMVSKFFGGFIINGPFAALTTYVSEFHCAKQRARVQMMLGIVFSSGTVILPLLAWGILPLDMDVKAFNNVVEFHSWNLYLLVCATPALLGSIAFMFMPESPKFLMTTGRYDEALNVFKMVYSVNSGKSRDSFPIHQLGEEVWKESKHGGAVTANRTKVQALKEGWKQVTPLFFPPYLYKIILVCVMQLLFMMSLNTLRLWLPQIFQAINDYEQTHNETSDLCTMILSISPKNTTVATECVVNLSNNAPVYINSMIVALVTIAGYIAAGLLINILGKKRLLNALGIFGGTAAMCLYFAQDALTTIVLSSIFTAFGSISINVVLAVVVDLFPTTLRTMTVSITMMLGRSGPLIGNIVFPLLLIAGCAPPFIFVGSVIFFCAILSCLLPDTDQKPLQ